jgi:hypothetical protein
MQLISRIINTGELPHAIEWGINADDFLTQEGRAMFMHLLGYYSRADTSGAVIGPNAMQQVYPNFVFCDDPGMTIEALCLEVRKTRLGIEGSNKLDAIREMFGYNPLEALTMMSNVANELTNIGMGKNTDVTLGHAFDAILQKYEMKKSGVDMSCGMWPWAPLQEATGGFQDDDYIVFYGRPKSFKSWVLACLIAWLFNIDKRVLIYTKEMTPENIFMRVIACIAQISYYHFRMANLSYTEEEALYAARAYVNALQARQQLVVLSGKDAPEGGDTVPWLEAKARKYNPNFICVDGLYLMSDTKKAVKDNVRVMNISRDFRQMILRLRIPGIITLQANRAAAKHQDANLDEVAFSDAIAQDATCVIRVINEKETPTVQLVLGGAREYSLNGFRINANPAYDFSYHGPLTTKDIEKAKQADDKEAEEKQAKANKAAKVVKVSERQAAESVQARLNKEL